MIGANLKAIVIVKWPAVANKATIPKNKISWKLGVTQKIIAKGAKVIVTMKLRATRISKVLSVADTIEPKFLLPYPKKIERYDPHVWMDPILWLKIVEPIKDALTQLIPQQEDYFNNKSQKYIRTYNEY